MEELQVAESSPPVVPEERPRSRVALVLASVTGVAAVGLTALSWPFVAPAFRKVSEVISHKLRRPHPHTLMMRLSVTWGRCLARRFIVIHSYAGMEWGWGKKFFFKMSRMLHEMIEQL